MRQYIKPTIQIVMIQQSSLLQGSIPVSEEEITDVDYQLSRELDFSEWEEL